MSLGIFGLLLLLPLLLLLVVSRFATFLLLKFIFLINYNNYIFHLLCHFNLSSYLE